MAPSFQYYIQGEGPGPVGSVTDLGGQLRYRVDAAGNVERRNWLGQWVREHGTGFDHLVTSTTPLSELLGNLRYWTRQPGARLSDLVPDSVLSGLSGTGYRYFGDLDSALDYAASVAGHLVQDYLPDTPAPPAAQQQQTKGGGWSWSDLFPGASRSPVVSTGDQLAMPSWLVFGLIGVAVLVLISRR